MSVIAGRLISVEEGIFSSFLWFPYIAHCPLPLVASFVNLGAGSYMHMCVPGKFPVILSDFFFVALIADGTMLFILVLIRAVDNIRKYGANRTANQFTMMLVQDSALCFTAYAFSSRLTKKLILMGILTLK